MSRRRGFLVALAIVAGAVAVAVGLVSLAPEPERTEPPSRLPFVVTAPVVAGSGAIPVNVAGTVRPTAEIQVAPEVGGKVVWVHPDFQSGGRIDADDTIFRIEEADYRYRLRDAEAALAARRAAWLQVQEEAAIARTEYERYAGRDPEALSADRANPLALWEPQLEAARAALDREQAKVAEANLALSRTRVRAPFDGFVREESVDVGQFVTAGRTVARLFAADAVEVVAPLSDQDAALIPGLWSVRSGDGQRRVPARVVAEYGDARYAWAGQVDRVEAALDAQTRTIDVVVRVPDPFESGAMVDRRGTSEGGPPLLVGKFVEVEIEGLAPERHFRVARAALQPGDEIWAVDDGGTVSVVPVRVLQHGDDVVFVTGALREGQAAVVAGLQFATEGMRVRTDETPGG